MAWWIPGSSFESCRCHAIYAWSPACALALAVALAGCGGAGTSSAPHAPLPLASAQLEGFDTTRLRAADRRFQRTPGLGSVLMQRHGRLVFERYYHGASRGQKRNVYSVTKSILSALVGIALRDARLSGLDQKLVEFFPGELGKGADPRVKDITLRDLLTMTAGYRETEVTYPDDFVRTLLNRPLASKPGATFSYDDGSAHLLSALLTKATRVPVEVLADRHLFAPLRIDPGPWPSDDQGNSLGSTGLSLDSRALLKIGELYLRAGNWRGRQLIPAAWVRESTTTQVKIRGGFAYGYLWWINTGPNKGFVAQGYGGQMIAVLPRLNLVVVMTGGGDYDRFGLVRLLLRAVDE
jgi:CubicO group peptidase (beta-lactamase class C family)